MSEMDLDGFLNHSPSAFTKFNRLKDWKKNGYVLVFLHTRASITAKWSHQIPTLVTRKIDGEDVTEVWSRNHVCHENENTLKYQNKRKVDDTREVPPEHCGVCKMVEWFRTQVYRNGLNWTTPVFRFIGDDESKAVTIHAGGLFNGYKGDLTKEEVEELKKAGIFRKEAWKENATAGLDYVFRVVNAEDIASGIQIATETSLLGDKVKTAIHQAMKSHGQEQGDPRKHPYCIRWEYNAAQQEFSKKYDAFRVETHKATKPILELIRDTDPPDISKEMQKFDPLELGAMLEKACLIKGVPFESFFKPEGHSSKGSTPQAKPTPKEAPKPAEAPVMGACDGCGTPIDISLPQCPHCGHTFDIIEEEAPPPPPPMKTRSQLAAERKANQAKPAPKPVPAEEPAADDELDQIPFLSQSRLTRVNDSPNKQSPW